MNRKVYKLLKRKSEKERERNKIILNLIGYSSLAGIVVGWSIVGIIWGVSSKLEEGTELRVNWKEMKAALNILKWAAPAILVVIAIVYSYYYYRCQEITIKNWKGFKKGWKMN